MRSWQSTSRLEDDEARDLSGFLEAVMVLENDSATSTASEAGFQREGGPINDGVRSTGVTKNSKHPMRMSRCDAPAAPSIISSLPLPLRHASSESFMCAQVNRECSKSAGSGWIEQRAVAVLICALHSSPNLRRI
jgi:hypothetical protein